MFYLALMYLQPNPIYIINMFYTKKYPALS